MALGFQARAMLRGLAKLGEPSSLQGEDCGAVAIERNVIEFAGIGNSADDNPTVRHTVATIDASFDPRVGQRLDHPSGSFVLDNLMFDDGITRRFIVVAVP